MTAMVERAWRRVQPEAAGTARFHNGCDNIENCLRIPVA